MIILEYYTISILKNEPQFVFPTVQFVWNFPMDLWHKMRDYSILMGFSIVQIVPLIK